MTFFQPTVAAFKSIFAKPKPGPTAYNGTHTGPGVYTTNPTFKNIKPAKIVTKGILRLPPEILLDIFELALSNNEGISKLFHPNTIGRTCRRFHEVLLPYIYSDCKMVFQYSAFCDTPGCIYSRDKLELFRNYGVFVRKLSIMADCTVLPREVERIRRFPWAPSLPSALFDLTPSFTYLTSLELDGKFDNSIPDLVHSLQYLLTNSPYLIKLSMNIHARWGVEQMEVHDHLFKTIKMEQSDESTSYANLEWLSFSLVENSPDSITPPGKLKRFRLLEILCLILKPATKRTKYLHFNIPIQGLETYYDNHLEQIEEERSQFFHFPELMTLSISAVSSHIYPLYRFVDVDYERVKELKVLVDLTKFDRARFPSFLKRFSILRILDINNVQEMFTGPGTFQPPWWHIQPWKYLRDSIILPRPRSLRVFKVRTTGDVKRVIEDQLGWDVLRVCKVDVRWRHTSSVRQVFKPYQTIVEGKFDAYEVRLEF
ncbi:hypothetical protein TWF281_009053 [Arthrobotrys megalospora]